MATYRWTSTRTEPLLARRQLEDLLLRRQWGHKILLNLALAYDKQRPVVDTEDVLPDSGYGPQTAILPVVRQFHDGAELLEHVGVPFEAALKIELIADHPKLGPAYIIESCSSLHPVPDYPVRGPALWRSFGEHYKFPPCCIEKFVEGMLSGGGNGKKFTQYNASELLEKTELSRVLAYAFHVPCSTGCEPTLDEAHRYQAYVRKTFPRLAERVEEAVSRFDRAESVEHLLCGPRQNYFKINP